MHIEKKKKGERDSIPFPLPPFPGYRSLCMVKYTHTTKSLLDKTANIFFLIVVALQVGIGACNKRAEKINKGESRKTSFLVYNRE